MVPEKMNQLRFSPERYDQITRGPDASMLHRNPRARPPPFFFDICAHFKDGIFFALWNRRPSQRCPADGAGSWDIWVLFDVFDLECLLEMREYIFFLSILFLPQKLGILGT